MFNPAYHEELSELFWANFKAPGYTKYGVTYNSGYSRASGAPDTSLGNTLDNALVAYLVLRETGLAPKEAWEQLGLYGGDDGLTPGDSIGVYTRVTKQLGLSIKSEVIKRSEPVPFLGRIFHGHWDMPTDSMCDVGRQLKKLHFTTAPSSVPDWVVLYRKAVGLKLTDSGTPVLGAWASAVIRCCAARKLSTEGFVMNQDERWFEQYDAADQYDTNKSVDRYRIAADNLRVGEEYIHLEEARLNGLHDTATISDLFPGNIFPGKIVAEIGATCGGYYYPPITVVVTPDASTQTANNLPANDPQPTGCGIAAAGAVHRDSAQTPGSNTISAGNQAVTPGVHGNSVKRRRRRPAGKPRSDTSSSRADSGGSTVGGVAKTDQPVQGKPVRSSNHSAKSAPVSTAGD
jgi:hypothetical protein